MVLQKQKNMNGQKRISKSIILISFHGQNRILVDKRDIVKSFNVFFYWEDTSTTVDCFLLYVQFLPSETLGIMKAMKLLLISAPKAIYCMQSFFINPFFFLQPPKTGRIKGVEGGPNVILSFFQQEFSLKMRLVTDSNTLLTDDTNHH